ncbi:MAG: EAL domain-containing protein [Gammaproteobacteria bacterium]|nr:EAL domain-containing protein [Gammaproteobacteria bacterium]
MDDFRTGYSSLSYITQLAIDELKIVHSFISYLNTNEKNKAMVTSILNLAKTFDLSIVAEGVETEEQIDFLARNDCDILQGFYFSDPFSASEFESLYFGK